MDYLKKSSVDEGTLESDAECNVDVKKILSMLSGFFHSTRSLFWLEILSLTDNIGTGLDILWDILSQSKSRVRL